MSKKLKHGRSVLSLAHHFSGLKKTVVSPFFLSFIFLKKNNSKINVVTDESSLEGALKNTLENLPKEPFKRKVFSMTEPFKRKVFSRKDLYKRKSIEPLSKKSEEKKKEINQGTVLGKKDPRLARPFHLKAKNSYLIPDFVEIQRKSFFELLKTGLIEEFSKRNPITNQNLEIFFYPEYYQLSSPQENPRRAILNSKSYSAKLFIPVQLTDKKLKKSQLKWVLIGSLPLMTNRGHFLLNGAPRVIVNQILRSPGIYFQGSLKEVFSDQWSEKPDKTYKCFYTDLICLRGTWLRIEIDKKQKIWAQMKKVPKIPLIWFLLAMGLTERIIFKSILNPTRLLSNFVEPLDEFSFWPEKDESTDENSKKKKIVYNYVTNTSDAWKEIANLISSTNKETNSYLPVIEKSSKKKKVPSLGTKKKEKKIEKSKNLIRQPFLLVEKDPPEKRASFSLYEKSSVYSLHNKQFPLDREILFNSQFPFLVEKSKDSTNSESREGSNSEYSEDNDRFSWKINKEKTPLSNKKPKGLVTFLNVVEHSKEGRNWIFQRFMNPRAYDLGSQGRLNFNKKLGLSISPDQMTLTAQDLLFATDYLLKVEKGLKNIDDIDHLKNRRVRTSGELLQIQIGVGLVRLEQIIRDKLEKINAQRRALSFLTSKPNNPKKKIAKRKTQIKGIKGIKITKGIKGISLKKTKKSKDTKKAKDIKKAKETKKPPGKDLEEKKQKNSFLKTHSSEEKEEKKNPSKIASKRTKREIVTKKKGGLKKESKKSQGVKPATIRKTNNPFLKEEFKTNHLINTKPFNGALREFFGSSPLSQFMDQLNPLAEITHKRRLSSMGPGGVTRDSATLAIRGIHPTHYGRICPIETPEGKNTGLVNSLTSYARASVLPPSFQGISRGVGFLESPFYKVYKGQIQKNAGMFFFSAEQEEKVKVAAADAATSSGRLGFLPKTKIPAKIAYGDTISKIPRNVVEYIGVSPIQMISIATSLIPFLEHDDANRALMGSNMQRQAVPLVRAERPLIGTGIESRAVSDSGHAVIAKKSGYVTYVSAKKIIIYTIPT